ncbi:hypothetical protein EB820_20125, partial [Brevibacillus agri]
MVARAKRDDRLQKKKPFARTWSLGEGLFSYRSMPAFGGWAYKRNVSTFLRSSWMVIAPSS